MKRILIALFCGAFLCLGADAPKPAPGPKLTDTQKTKLLKLQLNLERTLRKVTEAQKEFQEAQAALVAEAKADQPGGFQITEDPTEIFALVPIPNPEPAKKEEKK